MKKSIDPWVEQEAKFKLMSDKLGLTTIAEWKDALVVSNRETVSGWKKGSGVSGRYANKIVELLGKKGFSIGLFELKNNDLKSFSRLIGAFGNDEPLNQKEPQIFNENKFILNEALTGRYLAAFLSRKPSDPLTQGLSLELFEWVLDENKIGTLHFHQLCNTETNELESGTLYVGADRYCGVTYYKNFPPSVYYLCPVVINNAAKIFFGIYTDITNEPNREIFSTRILFFNVPETFEVNDNDCVDKCLEFSIPILENSLKRRGRLVVEPPTFEARIAIVDCVQRIKATLGILT